MAPYSSTLVWEIPWTEEPGGLQSVGSQKESDRTEATQHARMQARTCPIVWLWSWFPKGMHLSNSLNCINFQSGKERVKEERGVGSWESLISPGKFRDLFPWVGGGWTECQITKVRGRELISALKGHSRVISPNPCDPCTHLSCLESFPLSSHVYLF